jgi:hypothetical protein
VTIAITAPASIQPNIATIPIYEARRIAVPLPGVGRNNGPFRRVARK